MKNRLRNIILLLIVLVIPINVFATSDAVVPGIPGAIPVSGDCPAGSSCKYFTGALRFTFVDEHGAALSNSFDFVTYLNQSLDLTFHYNALTGDKSKLTGGFEFATASYRKFPRMTTFIGKYNYYIDQIANRASDPKKGIKSTLPTTGDNTWGWSSNSWESERAWFENLTRNGLSEEQYQANIEAFSLALQDMYSDFNAESMKLTMQEKCAKGEEVFIQMEPMNMVFTGGMSPILGTIRDILQFYSTQRSDYLNKMITYLNKTNNNYLWNIYYDRKINAPNFDGYQPVSPGNYTLSTAASMNDKVGYAVGLDWANDERSGCNECKFQDGKFTYDDEEIVTAKSPFVNILSYVLTPASEDGLGCCGALGTAIKNSDPNVTEEHKEYYKFYCDLSGDPCTDKEFNVDDPNNHVYFCPDGKSCEFEKWKKECNIPDCEPDENNIGNKCCEIDPIEQGKIEGDINNCCTDGTESEAHEYDLDELFCKNDFLDVESYQMKCGADFYTEEGTALNGDYCNMYCTERVSVEIPSSIAATSGRYFKLTTTSKGTTSSYIEGYKRCRIRIQYDLWESDYYSVVEEQVEAYNQFQYDKAYQKLYEKAEADVIPNQTETSNITCGCTCSYTGTCSDGKGGTTSCTQYASASDKGSCTIKYNKYPFKKMFDIYPVKINEELRDNCEDIYEAIEFKNATSYKTQHNDWSAWEIDPSIAECNNKVSSMQVSKSAGPCSCTLSCSRTTTQGEQRREDVHTVRQDYNNKADQDNTLYNQSAEMAKELEDAIDQCDLYFKEYEGANAEDNYKFNASQQFSYTQVYMNTVGALQLDEIFIDFETEPGCVVDPVVVTGADSDDKLRDDQYSNKYSSGQEKMTDFMSGTLDYEKTSSGWKKYRDETYEADKIFTTDAKYHVTCSWNEGENNLYTLVPNGAASESTSEINYTEHEQHYKVYLTTLEGTYQTYWDIRGLGTPRKGESKGRFDDYFLENGKTCSNEDPKDRTMLTCKIYSEHEMVLTGYCNGSFGSDTTVDPDDCDPYEEGYRLFNFKVVDPVNLFPSGVNTVDGKIAYNWTETTEGQKAMQEIQATGAKDQTYAPDNLTYSFALSPSDMRHIKSYNASRVEEGGYSDFDLECSKETCESGACSKCKSIFLENLASGVVNYRDINHSVSGWSNSTKDIVGIRKEYGWK